MKFLLAIFLSAFFTATKGEILFVTNIEDFNHANKIALPGDKIVLQNGLWNNCHFKLNCKGTDRKPIIITAETPGKVIVSGNSSLKLGGEYISVVGLFFKDGFSLDEDTWEFKIKDEIANHCRITNCKIENFNNPNRLQDNNWVVLYGKHNRIDHCSFIHKTNLGVLLAVKMDDDRSRESYHNIDSNYFGIRLPLGSNGGEIIRVGLAQHCNFNSRTTIKNNLFENCDGETEIISIKSSGNFVLQNLFLSCQGAVVLRHGNNNTVEGNIFDGKFKKGTGGVRIINEGNWVTNNLFIHCRGEGFRSPLSIMNGVYNSPPTRYVPVTNALVLNNTFVDCSPISFGEGADLERSIPPTNVYFINNLIDNNIDTAIIFSHSNTDGFIFKNNFSNNQAINEQVFGFSHHSFLYKKFQKKCLIPYVEKSSEVTPLSPTILSEIQSRLRFPIVNHAGIYEWNFFKKLQKSIGSMGINWKMKKVNTILNDIAVQCKDVNDIILNIQRYKTCKIILTGSTYQFHEPVIIRNNVTILSNKRDILFEGISNLPAFFWMTKNASLTIDGIHFLKPSNFVDCFISSDSSFDCSHYNINVTNCVFDNLNRISKSFFYAKKTTYADLISIKNCAFTNGSCNIFSLLEETDKKGYYNAEQIQITNNSFQNIHNSIFEVVRSGSDESTMGPMVVFNNNQLKDCNHNDALISFSGVQYSTFYNNHFDHSNEGYAAIKYEDNTKSMHYQKDNLFNNSGFVIENKFVNNLK